MVRQRFSLLLLGAFGWFAVAGIGGGGGGVEVAAADAVVRSTRALDLDALGTGGDARALAADSISSAGKVYVEPRPLGEGALVSSSGRSLLHGCHSKLKASKQTEKERRMFLKCVEKMSKCPRCRFPRGSTKGHCKAPALKKLFNCKRRKDGKEVVLNSVDSKPGGLSVFGLTFQENGGKPKLAPGTGGGDGDEFDDTDLYDSDEEVVPADSIYDSGYEY